MKKQMLWKNVEIGQMVYYGNELLEKYKADRARAKDAFGKCGTWYGPNEMVEVEIEEKPAATSQSQPENNWKQAPATEKQLSYLADLGVVVNKSISRGLASELIGCAKNHDSIGHLGFFYSDGSN